MTESSIAMDWLPGPPEAPRLRIRAYGLALRGKYTEFPLMRTSLDRGLGGLVANDNYALRGWHMFILSEVATRGLDPLVHTADVMMPDPA